MNESTTIGGERAPDQASATVTDELARKAASAMGRKGGMAKSAAKAEAARINGQKGGFMKALRSGFYGMRHIPSTEERKAKAKAQRAARRLNR